MKKRKYLFFRVLEKHDDFLVSLGTSVRRLEKNELLTIEFIIKNNIPIQWTIPETYVSGSFKKVGAIRVPVAK